MVIKLGAIVVVVGVIVAVLSTIRTGVGPDPFVCRDPIGCVTVLPDEPIKFGVILALSGGSVLLGSEQANIIQLILEQRNGRFLNHPVELVFADERCSPEGGAIAALRLVADPAVIGIWGTTCSGAAVTAARIMSEAGLVMVSPSNTATDLTLPDTPEGARWWPGYFRTAWNDSELGLATAVFAFQRLYLRRAAIVHAGDAYTRGLAETFANEFTRLGGEISLEITIDEEDRQLGPVMEALAIASAEMVYLPLSYPDTVARLTREIRARPYLSRMLILGGETMGYKVYLDEAGEAAVGTYLAVPSVDDTPAIEQLADAYQTRYGEGPPSQNCGFTHDAVTLLLRAVERVAVIDETGSLHIGRQALREALHQTVSHPGLTGRLSCNRFGDCGRSRFVFLRFTDLSAGLAGLYRHPVYFWPPDDAFNTSIGSSE
jgi:branched-chain amino acid transport system substrate-binding protein